jgi:chromosome segregation ATPase
LFKTRQVNNKITDAKKNVSLPENFPQEITSSQLNQDYSILYAEITEQINTINQTLTQIYDKIALKTQTEIISEIESLKTKLDELTNNVNQIKSDEQTKKLELTAELSKTQKIFNNIKQLLEIDYESLSKQRDYLKRQLQIQEIEYKNLSTTYQHEIEKLNNLILELKSKYPQELLTKLQLEVSEKTRLLDNIETDYKNLKLQLTEKMKSLDDILTKKSAEIQSWFETIKTSKEEELLQLKCSVDTLKPQVEQLNFELKNIILSIEKEQVEKKSLISQLNKELQIIKSRQFEIESLKSRKNFLETEIARLENEYNQLQSEYKTVTAQKALEIQNLKSVSEENFLKLSRSWEEQEQFYKKEIKRLTKRNTIFLQRKQRLLKIEKQYKEKLSLEQKVVEEKLLKSKIEFEKNKNELESSIRLTLNRLELAEKEFKQKIEKLKTDIKRQLQEYNDKILELKKRSEIREQRIKKKLNDLITKNEPNVQNLLTETEKNKKDVETILYETKSYILSQETKLLSNKEQLELYQYGLKDIIEKFELTKNEVKSLETEIVSTEKNVYDKLDEILKNIVTKKQTLIEKLLQLLSTQEEVIIKSSQPHKTKTNP